MFNIFLHNDNCYEYLVENTEAFTKKNLITIYFFIIIVCVLIVSSISVPGIHQQPRTADDRREVFRPSVRSATKRLPAVCRRRRPP